MASDDSRFRSFAERYVIARADKFKLGNEEAEAWEATLMAKSIYRNIAQVSRDAEPVNDATQSFGQVGGVGQIGQLRPQAIVQHAAAQPLYAGKEVDKVTVVEWMQAGLHDATVIAQHLWNTRQWIPQGLETAIKNMIAPAALAIAPTSNKAPRVVDSAINSKAWTG